jgi:hypothetical protein
MLTTQLLVPVQAPDQPTKLEPLAAAAVSVTLLPLAYVSVQSAPQSIPLGDEVTVPLPVPALPTVSANPPPTVLKVAVTLRAAVMLTVQGPVPVHAPDQPAKTDPPAAVAVKLTLVPLA